MNNPPVDWVSALAIVAAALILGFMFVFYLRSRKGTAPPTEDLVLRDLEAKRDVLVRQISELADIDSKFSHEQAAEERTRLEMEAAKVLRAIDQQKKQVGRGGVAVPAADTLEPAANGSRAARMGFLWGAGSVALLAVLGYFVVQSTKERGQNEGVTGGTGMGMQAGQQQAPPADPAVLALEAQVQKSPDDMKVRVELARAYLEHQNLMGVYEQTQFVLAKEPDNPRALAYQGLVRLAMGQADESLEMLKKSTRLDPTLLDGWVALAWAQTQTGAKKDAEKSMQEAIKRHPEEKTRLEQILLQMKNHENMPQQPAAAPAGQGGDLPPGHPPMSTNADGSLPAGHPPVGDGGAMGGAMGGGMGGAMGAMGGGAPAPAADPKATISVTLDVDPASKSKVTGKGILYVIARPQGVTSGAPTAVKRLMGAKFPMTFELSSADSMMGQPLPAKVRLEARLDSDGDAATKNPNDPVVVQDGIAAGSKIKLSMK